VTYADIASTDDVVDALIQGFGSFKTLELLLTCVGHHHYEVGQSLYDSQHFQ